MKIYGVGKGERPEQTFCLRFEYQRFWGRHPRPLVVVPMPGDLSWTTMKNFIMEKCQHDAWLHSNVEIELDHANILFEIHFQDQQDFETVKAEYNL